MIVSFGTCDLKLYTVKFLLFVCSLIFLWYVGLFVCLGFVFFATACTYCFRKGKDIVNVSVEGYLRKERREGERVRGGKSCSLQMFGSRLSPRMWKPKRVIQKRKKKGFGQKSKPKKCNGEPKGGIIDSLLAFFCLLRCLFSLKK